MLKNESNLWDSKYRESRNYVGVEDFLIFSNSNPTILAIEKYIKNGVSVLEIGSGTGELICYLKSKYSNVKAFGVDYSQESVKKSRESVSRFNIDVDFVQGDIKKMYYLDNSFDIVFGDQVIGHIDNMSEALAEIYRVLKPGGFCFLSTVNKLRFDGWDLYKKISLSHHGYTQRSFFPWKFKSLLLSSSFNFVGGYGDMIFLTRNLNVIKSRIFGSKNKSKLNESIKDRSRVGVGKINTIKKLYGWLDRVLPWWVKISIGIIVRK